MLTWDEAQPGCHLPTIMKIVPIAQRCHKCSRTQGPNALHLLQPLTRFHLVAEARELTRDLGNTGIQRTQLTLQALQEVAHQEGQAIVCLFVSGHRGSKGANLTNELTESPHPPGGVAMEAS